MNSTYLSPKSKVAKKKNKIVALLVASFFMLMTLLGGAASASLIKPEEASAADPVQFIMCIFDKESVPGMIYQATQTSDLNFQVHSKSSVTSGQEDVAVGPLGLNWILGLFMDFQATNEEILGKSLGGFEGSTLEEEGAEPPAEGEEEEPTFNTGDKVTPFDRFGVAGLTWTNYIGEWKYVQVDACATEGAEPKDPKAGMFYEERLEPRSTYEDIPKTKDVRTAQFAKGSPVHLGAAMVTLIANAIFFFTKVIVTLTIAFINFSFSDIAEIMGINEFLAGDSGGIFQILYNGLFTPLIILVFFLTGVYVFWQGIVKKQYRTALTSLLRSVILFIIAIVIAASPATFIALPNQVAIVIQSVLVNTMNTGIASGDGICVVDGEAAPDEKIVKNSSAKDEDILEQASSTMRSAIGCQLWETFLLKPWAEGQFGANWDKLWVAEKTPDWVDSDVAEELSNTNTSVVGEAALPVGGETYLNNWALYQISTQTNAHSPTNHEGELSKYTSGVANDWWRIVDATSNYNEKTTKVNNDFLGTASSNNWGDQYVEVSIEEPDLDSVPTEQWDNWVGNNPWNRIGIALTSIIAAGVGLAAPLVFAFFSGLYAVGVAILMAFAPLMLLLGCWAGRGWEIFKGWGELVIDTTMKRIVAGLMMVFSVILLSTILKLMDSMGYWWGLIALIIVSVMLIKSRQKIFDAAAAIFTFKFSNVDFGSSAKTFYNNTAGRAARLTGGTIKTGANLAAGGVAAKAAGGTFADGLKKGIKTDLKNRSYQNKALRPMMTTYESHKSGQKELDGQEFCQSCQKVIDYEIEQDGTGIFLGGRDINGGLYCKDCFDSGEAPADAVEFMAKRKSGNAAQQELLDGSNLKLNEEERAKKERRNSSWADEKGSSKLDRFDRRNEELSQEELKALSEESSSGAKDNLGQIVGETIFKDKEMMEQTSGKFNGVLPEIPDKFKPFLAGNEHAIEQMWAEGKIELVLYMYSVAAVEWFYSEHEDAERGSLNIYNGSLPSEEVQVIHAEAFERFQELREEKDKS